MPINRLLKQGEYGPREVEVLNKAFDLALRLLGLVDRNDPICELVAQKVIAVAAADDDLDAQAVAERAARELRP